MLGVGLDFPIASLVLSHSCPLPVPQLGCSFPSSQLSVPEEEERRLGGGGERSPAARQPEIDAACCVILQVKMSPAATRVRLVNSLSTAPGSSCSTHRTRTAYGST